MSVILTRKELIDKYISSNHISKGIFITEVLKMSNETYFRFVNGKNVSIATIERFADVLNCSVDELLGRVNDK